MQLTKKIESDILDVYEAFWGSLLHADIERYTEVLDVDYRLIGTTEKEVFFNKQEAVRFLEATAVQMAGNLERRNSIIKMEAIESLILITEQFDAYVLIDSDWTFYGKTRVSTLMQQQLKVWKLVQQHFSFPDTKAEDGQTIGLEKIAKENLELREAVKRRTIELEEKNRKLGIEAALERVRSTSMAMHTSQDLSTVVYTLFTELVKLDAQLDRCLILIVDPQTLGITWYLTGKEGLLSSNGFLVPDNTHPSHQAYLEGWRTRRKKWHYLLAGEEKQRWDTFGFSETELAQLPDFIKADMAAVKAIHLTISSDDFGCLIASSLSPLSDAHASIVERFTIVFNQTYTRFLDLQKAEAQAREAQIEAALERVRSRSMAMHKSEELPEVIQLVFGQLKQLNFNIDSAQFDVNFRESDDLNMWTAVPGQPYPTRQHIPYFNNAVVNSVKNAKEAGLTLSAHNFTFEEKNEFFNHFFKHTSVPEERREFILSLPGWARSVVYLDSIYLGIQNYSGIPYSEAEHTILGRFAKVFEQTYTRFLDLQKAEAQAREAQIELGLERVRARAMAMQNSDELKELIGTVFTELTKLDLALTRCIIWVFEPASNGARWWMANSEEPSNPMSFYIKYHKHPAYLTFVQEWKKQNAKFVYDLVGDDKITWDDILFNETELKQLPDIVKDGMRAPERVLLSASFNNFGGINVASLERLSDEHFDILLRFAKVFDLTYTRFNDLKKAEAQAREAQIEAALERVRSRSMAMRNSNELKEVIGLVLQQFVLLNINAEHAGFYIDYKVHDDMHIWLADPNIEPFYAVIPYFETPTWNSFLEAKANGTTLHTDLLDFNTKNKFYKSLFKLFKVPEEAQEFYLQCKGLAVSTVLLDNVGLYIENFSAIPYTDAENEILIRIGKVFQQTYLRFLDLQKAEAQAREAQIEAALERVRSRSLAMHKSFEIQEVVAVVFTQLQQLGLNFEVIGIGTRGEDTNDVFLWIGNDQHAYANRVLLPHMDFGPGRDVTAAMDSQIDFVSMVYSFEEKNRFWEFAFENSGFRQLPDTRKQYILNSPSFSMSVAPVRNIVFLLIDYTGKVATEQEATLIRRFAKVFEQCYVRFQDLQKAEANARESTIEAALEKVRGKAMAMQNSNDISSTISIVFSELHRLGIESFRSGVGLISKETRKMKFYSSGSKVYTDQNSSHLVREADLNDHKLLVELYDYWMKQEDYFPVLKGEQLISFYDKLKVDLRIDLIDLEHFEQYGYCMAFSEGIFYGWSEKPYAAEEIRILHRFKSIVDLSFRRYIELQKSEEIAREAVRSASLDRVRAEIASMRTRQDLERITPLIWNELTTLGITFLRCGVFIMDEQEKLIHTFLSTPDGKAIAAFHVPYSSTPLAGAIEFWRGKQTYLTHWGLKEYTEFADAFIDKHDVGKRAHYLSSVPKEGIHLHLLPFLQGMLYVGNDAPLEEDELQLLQSLADAFSTAYARYEDFNKLEAAKAVVEFAMSELKATQSQLVQQEKLASLGQLTAGIAHEIKNPLNFINNFSDVSAELIDEVLAEIHQPGTADSKDEIVEMLNSVKSNLNIIHQHGSRADSIVKSMLMHSRSSTGRKEPADLNVIIRENVNLAFHAMRATGNPILLAIELELDDSVGEVLLITEDFSRVILNLCNNAFDAMRDKMEMVKMQRPVPADGLKEDYAPKLTLRSRRNEQQVTIEVEDNGPGVPEEIRDKIFQPFFTTKKGTLGTGLGLSITHDIIKAHGGTLEIETESGKFSRFIISII